MSHKRAKMERRSRRNRQADRVAESSTWTPPPDFCFTPILNAALSRSMKNSRFNDTERVDMCLIRSSWGNWYPYAVVVEGSRTERQMDSQGLPPLDDLLFGNGPCPLCGTSVGRGTHLPKGFRWHRKCIALAYARDAARLGNDTQKKWAAEVLGEST